MGYTKILQALAVAAVIALVLVVAVFPIIDRMDTGSSSSMEANETPCAMSMAPEGYAASVTLVSVSEGGLESSVVSVTEGDATRTVRLLPGEAMCWLMDTGAVLATSAGVSTPASPDGMEVGGVAEISSGQVAEAGSSTAFSWLIAPSASGSLGLYLQPFAISSLGSLYMLAGQSVGMGLASSVRPCAGPGTFEAEYETGDGFLTVTGGSYTDGSATVPASAFVAPIEHYDPSHDAGSSVQRSVWGVLPLILLVGVLGYVASVAWRELRWSSAT